MKKIVLSLLLLFLYKLDFAQSSGPSTPEVQKFTPSSTENMVNLFTGDFQYTIPIMDVGGYPINISYSSGLSMNQEAGVVGLGWNFNPGMINRSIRGIPDDFKGSDDIISKTYKTLPSRTFSTTLGLDAQLFSIGIAAFSGSVGGTLTYNNYRGLDLSLNNGISANIKNFKLGISASAGSNGSSISPSLSFNSNTDENAKYSQQLGISGTFSSLEGLSALSFNTSVKAKVMDENTNSSQTFGGSSQYNFPLNRVKQSFSPKIESPTTSFSVNLSLRLGLAVFGASGGPIMSGLYSQEDLKNKTISRNAFGYLYLDNATKEDLIDKSNEKERPIYENDNNLYLTYLEPDIYAVNGEGIGGSFRPFRKKNINAHDPYTSTDAISTDLGFEFHIAAGDHIGANANATFATSETGSWGGSLSQGNEVYFKNIGELNSTISKDSFKRLGGFGAKKVDLADNSLLTNSKQDEYINTNFSYLTASEACYVGLTKELLSYNSTSSIVDTTINRCSDYRKQHHISEITVTTDDGTRYVYGLPAYNIVQREYSFNVAKAPSFFQSEVPFSNKDASENNEEGRSQMFSMTETPAFVYAYHLTAIISPEYVDITGDGPSSDDFGTYTRFNYSLTSSNFAWRTPHKNNTANYNDGYLSDNRDQTGNYIYGEKEIWTLHSIESRNTIARFEYKKREDAYEPEKESTATPNGQQLLALDKISLYTKPEYISNPTNPTPIKRVYFGYDYSLCKGIPAANNPNTGKLTLKSLKFSYGTSLKETNSHYTFNYSNVNPNYNLSAVDKWGSYRSTGFMGQPQKRAPYSSQQSSANNDASAWLLNEILLPSGGKIEVSYEADDYAYVQDKKAMQMFKIIGFSSNENSTSAGNLYEGSNSPNNYMFVEVNENLTNPQQFHDKYLVGLDQLYVNSIVTLLPPTTGSPSIKENIKTFIELKKGGNWYGIVPNTNRAWIKIDDRRGYLGNINPISFDTWQKLAHERRDALYPPLPEIPSPTDIIAMADFAKSLIGSMGDIINVFRSFEGVMYNKSAGKTLSNDISFVRLNNPIGKKKGGGSRVKELRIFDNWAAMTNGSDVESVYGKKYDYTTTHNGETISSGVATYEPMIGGDENPFVVKESEFILGNEDTKLSNERKYYIAPFGESMMPGASVGYSKVTVQNLDYSNVTINSTGKTEHQFYTSKDFPTILGRTPIEKQVSPDNSIADALAATFFLVSKTSKSLRASQGFYIELNDMNGKPKSIKTFGAGNTTKPVAGVEYKYLTDGSRLSNQAKTILVNDDGSSKIKTDTIGIDYDFYVEMLESRSYSKQPGLQFNSEGIWWPFPPLYIPIPIPLPSYREDENKMNLKLTTKIVYRTGILSETINYKDDAEFSEKNILYDAKSGRVVIKESQNEYKEPYYTTTIPSYWNYKGMGFASKNEGKKTQLSAGIFNGGEEIFVDMTQPHLWIYKNSSGVLSIINEKGDNVVGISTFKVIRSGYRNMQSIPIQTVITKSNPIRANQLYFDKVIDASATEFDEKWQTYKAFRPLLPKVSCECQYKKFEGSLCIDWDKNDNGYRKINEGMARYFGTSIPNVKANTTFNPYQMEVVFTDSVQNTQVCKITFKFQKPVLLPFNYFYISPPNPVKSKDCSDTNIFYGKFEYTGAQSIQYTLESSCFMSRVCSTKVEYVRDPINCNIAASNNVVNPYILGLLGNWRQKSTHKYVTNRSYTAIALKDKGSYSCFRNYFTITSLPNNSNCANNWQRAEQTAIIDPFGKPIETLDALNRPTTQIFGYSHQLPLLTAVNAHYYQVGFDGFEDHDFKNQIDDPLENCPVEPTWQFDRKPAALPVKTLTTNNAESYIATYTSHTGRRSLRVASSITIEKNITPICQVPFTLPAQPNTNTYSVRDCDLIKTFNPLKNGTEASRIFKISAWVKEEVNLTDLNRTSANLNVTKTGGTAPLSWSFTASGPIIDGWRQINGQFEVSGPETNIKVMLNPATTGKTYFDDIRVFPYDATMKSHVFDPTTFRLMAELDENNFAIFYEYDNEGVLTRKKRETERGIYTIQEVRSGKYKTNN